MKTKLSIIQIIGICLIPVSMTIYHFVPQTREAFEGSAMINYLIAILYLILSFGDRPKGATIFKPKIPRINLHIVLSLLFVSCFTLNKDIHVFALTPVWLQLILILVIAAFILISFKDSIHPTLTKTASFIHGLGIVIYLYYTIVLMHFFPFAIIGMILLGLSVHLLVPFILCIVSIHCSMSKKCINANSNMVLGGFTAGIIFTICYSILFNYHTQQINNAQKDLLLNEKSIFPEWVNYAQNCTSPYWTKRIVGRDLLFEDFENNWWSFNFNTSSFSEIKQHDPLVAFASLFTDRIPLSNIEQVKVLSACANTRHYAYEKLWSGKDLRISKELTDARIYPEYRMAYTEKTIWIENSNQWENNQQEALLTFQLPEGAVATSLSLWMDGKEEKSRLTTRKKANTAYKTIVGRERTHPVVLHWQEGNRLTATIFPCTPKEARKVKIGVTYPLALNNNTLTFNNLKIQGPDNSQANEIVHIKVIGKSNEIIVPGKFKEELHNQFLYDGNTISEWKCQLKAEPISEKPFVFNGQAWQLRPLAFSKGNIPGSIYLDINNSWKKDEVEQILLKADKIPVYAYHQSLIQINAENMELLFDLLSKKAFSLFPVYKINNSANSLLITKGDSNSPIPSELENSVFKNNLIDYMKNWKTPIPTLVIDHKTSPFIMALNQYKIIDTRDISYTDLKSLNIDEWFKHYKLPKDGVEIPISDMAIVPCNIKNNPLPEKMAPSHLLRLYNYHKVMQKAGELFLLRDADIPQGIYDLCNEAFIVTPISSLIVLETQNDYERFGIHSNQSSLKNANLQDSGAVPEPGEWAMIIILGLVITAIYLRFK